MRRIRKDDLVQVISGRDKGRSGKVIRVLSAKESVVVEGVGTVKRHQKASPTGAPAGIVEKNAAIHWSKVMLIDPKTKKPSKVRFKIDGGKKKRVAKSGDEIQTQGAA